jgi:hypothetical protein
MTFLKKIGCERADWGHLMTGTTAAARKAELSSVDVKARWLEKIHRSAIIRRARGASLTRPFQRLLEN